MNKHLVIALTVATSLFYTTEAAPQRAQLNFVNGDKISGNIISMENGILEIDSPHFTDNATFSTANILDIVLTKAQTEQVNEPHRKDHLATLELEDRFGYEGEHGNLYGQLEELTDDKLTLRTSYAGILEVDRSLIKSITISDNTKSLYSGPKSIEEWNPFGETGTWSFTNNSLVGNASRGSIAQDINIPDKALLSFDLSWKVRPGLSLYLYADNANDEQPSAYYEIRLNSNYMYMQKSTPLNRSRQLAKTPNTQLNFDGQSAEISLYMDKKKGVFHVFVNDEMTYTFTDHTPSPESLGSSIYFRNDNESRMLIKNIQMKKWSNAIPTEQDQKSYAKLSGEGQRILLANGDAVVGKIGKINNGLLAVETKHTPLKIPLAGVRDLHLPPVAENHPKAERNDIKAYYHDGGWVMIDVTKINSSHILGENKAIGNCEFDLSAFKKLELNVYDKSQNKLRQLDAW